MPFTKEQETWLAAFADDGLMQDAIDAKIAQLDAARQAVSPAPRHVIDAGPLVIQLTDELAQLQSKGKP